MASSLAARILAAAPKSKAALLNQTSVGDKVTIAKFAIPMVNLMMSGSINGGMTCGIQQIVGDSRTFKCVDKDTPLTIYVTDEIEEKYFPDINQPINGEYGGQPITPLTITYGELIAAFNPAYELDKEFAIPEGVFVENGTAALIPVQHAIVKSPLSMIEIEFATGYKMIVSEEHVFRQYGVEVLAKDADWVDTSFGNLNIVSKKPAGMREAYDIQVPAPHWYVNDSNCIYSHNTNFSIFCISQYMKQHPDSVCVFLDSEFSAKPVFKQYGIDESRIVYIPFENLEEMKIYLAQMIKEAERGDNIFFFIDSISQVASLKEVTDATKGDVKVDMTRAKEMNSVFRMITPMLNIRNLPLFCINSFYDDTDSQYADPIIKGGKQSFLSSDTVWFVTRAQDKTDEGLKGWYFNYKALKSRFVKEKAVFKIHVTYDGGIDWASGLLELAVESKLVKQSGAWYELDASLKTEGFDKKFQRKDIDKKETGFLDLVLADPRFDAYCRAKYMLKDEEKMLLDQQLLEAEAQELN